MIVNEATGGEMGAGEFKTEEEWVKLCGDQISVSLIADSTAQAQVPKSVELAPVNL